MATRGIICRQTDKEFVDIIYSHNDNYLENTGKILNDYYCSKVKVDALFNENRDIRSIKPLLTDISFYTDEHSKVRSNPISTLNKYATDCGAEYIYVYTLKGRWVYKELEESGFSRFKDLRKSINEFVG